ncbi:MAG: filamentous hemagglutinin N-terminal domain-containing protein [Acidiphilium sp.]
MVEQNAGRHGEIGRKWRVRRAHRLLLASTALSAAILLSTAVGRAQTPPLPPANTTPQGGQVVGGSATIVQGNASTTINQASERTAINWQSFNVGSNAQVTFNQPNAQAVALNRVMANNPSVIAGHINANGQIVLMNQAGVVFAKGAQVNAEAIVVSTAGISTKKFMAGSTDFNQAPHPGASIVNDGTITVKQAGLAALVAPQVINHGLITAKLGHVILAGAETFTLDLYGDHLISLDVTKAVTKVDLGGKSVNALVTNDGVVIADGGTIQITAAQADQLVQSVLNVGGVLRADSVGQSKGSILIQGVGGDIQIAGNVLARGATPGSSGGTIGIDATGAVSVSSAARIDASGAAGGGVVALGTSVQRAQQGPSDKAAPRAASVSVAQGAEISADATQSGNGGQIVLLSHHKTTQAGTISAQGAGSGYGGTAEISSDGVILLSGTENVGAPSGYAGSVLLDPATLIVGTLKHGSTYTTISGSTSGSVFTYGNNSASPSASYVDASILNGITFGTIILQAASYIGVNQAIHLNSNVTAMTLSSGGSIDVNKIISLNGNLEINAGAGILIDQIGRNGGITANNLSLVDTSSTEGITLAAPISVGTLFAASVVGGGLIEQIGSHGGYLGTLTAANLSSDGGTIGGGVTLGNTANTIGTLGGLTISGGTGNIATSGSLVLAGTLADIGRAITLNGNQGITESAGGVIDLGASGYLAIINPSSKYGIVLGNSLNQFGSISGISVSGADITLADEATLILNNYLAARNIALYGKSVAINSSLYAANALIFGGSGSFNELSGASITAATIESGSGLQGTVNLTQGYNSVGAVGAFSIATSTAEGASFSLVDHGSLAINGPVNAAGNVSFDATTIGVSGTLDAAEISLTSAGANAGGVAAQAGSTISASGTISIQSSAGVSLAGTIDAVDLYVTDSNNNGYGVTFSGPIQVGSLFSATITSGGLVDQKGGVQNPTYSGVLTIGTLSSGGGTIAGGVLLGNATNQIDTIGALSVSNGSVVIGDRSALALNGLVDAGGNSVYLIDSAGITESSTGGIVANSLSLANASAAIDLASTLNAVDNFAGVSLSNGGFSLRDSGKLTVTGSIEAPSVLLGATSLDLAALVSVGNELTLASVGTNGSYVSQSGAGSIIATTLTTGTDSFLGAVDLSAPANAINTLAAFSTTGALILDEAGSLTIAGLVKASSISLGAQGGLSENGGTISTGLFSDTATLTGLTLAGANTITSLAAFNAGINGIDLNDPGARLTVSSESFDASGITLSAAGLNLDGTLNAGAGTVALGSRYGVTQGTAGAIIASVLTTDGTLIGPIGLGDTHNSINTLDVMSLGTSGSFDLADATMLTIAGSLTATGVTLGNQGVDILAPISVGTGVVSFIGPGVITEGTNGAVTAGTLEGTGTFGAINLVPVGTVVNAIGSLGAITASGNISLSTSGSLAIIGGVSTAGTLALSAIGLTENSGGAIDTNSLVEISSFANAVDLSGANSITNLGSFDVLSGNFILHDNNPLSLSNLLLAPNVKLIDPAGLTFGSTISVSTGGSIALISDALSDPAGVFLAPSGTIAVAPYNNTALYLGSPGNSPQALNISNSLANALLGSAQLVVLGSATASGTSFAASSIIGAGVIGTVTNTLDLLSDGAFTNQGTLTGGASSSLLIDVAGSVFSVGTLQAETLNVVAGGPFISGGLIDAVMMAGSAGAGISLSDRQNSIDNIGGLTAGTAGILIDDSAGLTLDGPIVAGPAAPISFLVNTVQATIGASISDPGGTVSFAPLGSTYGAVIGTGASTGTLGLGINLLGAISPDVAALVIGDHYTPVLTVNQGVSLGINNVSFVAKTIDIGGSLVVPGTLDLLAGAGGISQSAALNVGYLIGTASGGVVLNDLTNQIGALGNFTATSQYFSLLDNENLTIAGVLLASTASISAPSLDLTGFINVPGTLSLSGTHGIDEPGSITGGVLIGSGSGAVFLTGSNSITDLANFSVSGVAPFDLSNRSSLLVSGSVAAGDVTLSAAGMSISGAITTPGTLAFGSSGAITETGSINATSVSSSGAVSGNVTLLGTNNIDNIGYLTVSGGLTLNDLSSLTVAAPVYAAAATLTAAGISIPSLISVTGVLALNSAGLIKETGSIDAGSLINSAPNSSAVELYGANKIADLGSFSQSSAGTLVLDDNQNLTVSGSVSGGVVSLNAGPGVSIIGTVAVSTLAVGGSQVTEASTGSVDTNLLQSVNSISGNVSLVGINSIAQIADFFDNGALVVHDGADLLLGGTVSALNAAFVVPSLTIGGLLSVNQGATIDSSGLVSEPGSLTVGTSLNGSIGGDLSLTGTNNIASIGALTDNATIYLTDSAPLTIAGTLDAQSAFLTAPSMAINGLVSATSTLALASSSGVSEAGAIDAGLLTWSGAAGQNALLTGTNTIAILSNFGAPGAGTLAVRDNGLLMVDGSIDGAVASLVAGTLDLAGAISVANSLAIGASSSVSEGGSVIAPTLVGLGVIGGNVSLTGQNRIGALGSFSQAPTATLDLIDASALTINGAVTGGSATLSAAGLNFTGAVSMPGTLALASSGGVAEDGSIAAGVLTSAGPIIGNAILTGSNSIAVLGNFNDQGLLDLADSAGLTVAGPVFAPTATLTASSLAIAGLVSVSGALALSDSSASGGISETGTIDANSLESAGVSAGDASLTNANLIGTLGAWNNSGSFALADVQSLIVAGPFDAVSAHLQAPSIDFAGPVTANTVLAVQSTGSVVQTGGTIAVPTLVSDGVIGGSVDLGAGNAILNLDSFAVQGNLFLHDASVLTAGDPVSSAQAITLDASGINLVGDLQAATKLLLGSSGPVTEVAGATISTPLLESYGTLDGAVQLDSQANQIGSIGQFLLLNQPFSLIDNQALTVIGPVAAKAVSLTVQGLLTLDGVAGGGLYISGVYETPPGATVAPIPTSIDTVLTINGPTPQLVQTGIFTIDGPPLAGTGVYPNSDNTVFVLFDPGKSNSGSNATFQNLQANTTELILELNSGTASGQLFLNRLLVVGNAGGRINFIGTLGGVAGTGAAHNGTVFPFPSSNYQFNACPIGSVDCTILPIETVPESSPLLNFDLTPPRRRKLDRNVRLPGIAARDY